MEKQTVKDLVFWKSTYITWRNVWEKTKSGLVKRDARRFKQTAFRMVQRIEAGILICLLLIFAGCHAGAGVGVDIAAYYPNIPNKLEDPAESRKQSTQHTTGMARNNLPMVLEGGGK